MEEVNAEVVKFRFWTCPGCDQENETSPDNMTFHTAVCEECDLKVELIDHG